MGIAGCQPAPRHCAPSQGIGPAHACLPQCVTLCRHGNAPADRSKLWLLTPQEGCGVQLAAMAH